MSLVSAWRQLLMLIAGYAQEVSSRHKDWWNRTHVDHSLICCTVKGAVKSYCHPWKHTFPVFSNTDLSPSSVTFQPMSQQRANMAGTNVTHVMHFHCFGALYQITLWIHRRATIFFCNSNNINPITGYYNLSLSYSRKNRVAFFLRDGVVDCMSKAWRRWKAGMCETSTRSTEYCQIAILHYTNVALPAFARHFYSNTQNSAMTS